MATLSVKKIKDKEARNNSDQKGSDYYICFSSSGNHFNSFKATCKYTSKDCGTSRGTGKSLMFFTQRLLLYLKGLHVYLTSSF